MAEAGINDIMIKPFSPRALHRLLLKWTADIAEPESPKPNGHSKENGGNPLASFHYLYRFSRGDEQFIREMVEAFLQETPEGLLEMEEAAERGDWEALYQTAHRLKPGYEMMELNQLRTKTEALEVLLKAREVDSRQVSCQLRELTRQTRQALQSIRRQVEASR